MEQEKLRPCPFCGSEDIYLPYKDRSVECLQCGATILWIQNDNIDIITAWNPRVPGWIPVEERLPKQRTNVLLFSKAGSVSEVIGYLDENDDFECEWYDKDNCIVDFVTHWQPLPEPPEVSEE